MHNILTLNNPKPNTEFRKYNGRLALFHETTNHIEYWRNYWQPEHAGTLMGKGLEGDLGEFESLIRRYVPRDLPVLEAGCGPAHLVAALHVRKYSVVGIDYEPEVVAMALQRLPHLDIRHGNILDLEFASNHFGCYLSVGVVEHLPEGPRLALHEARRVLHPRGIALISVPYLNPVRQTHFRYLSGSASTGNNLSFHQYYYSADEFMALLNGAGFEVLELLPYATFAFLTREHPVFAQFWRSPLCRTRLKRVLRELLNRAPIFLRKKYGHMIMFACQKVGE